MSIQSEITRLSENVSDALTAIAAKGVTIPTGSNSDDLATLISQIQQGGGSGIVITDTLDTNGGIIREITAVDLSSDTVTADKLLSGYTAHNRLGEAVTGTYSNTYMAKIVSNTATSLNSATGVKLNGTRKSITVGSTFTFSAGDTLTVDASNNNPGTGAVYYNGMYEGTVDFSYSEFVSITLPASNIAIQFSGSARTDIDETASTLVVPLSATANDTYTAPSGMAYSPITVNVTPTLQAKTNINPSTSSQIIEPDSGYDGLSNIQINAMPNGSATVPASISGTSATVSTGTNTLTLSKTVSVTPIVTAGYVSSGTAGNSSVSLTASVTTKAAATITPTKSTQTISSGTYLTGTQTIAAIPAAYQDVTSVTAAAGDVVSGKAIVDSSGTVVNGTLVIQHYYTGSSAPSSSTGVDGDIYLQTS